MAKTVVIDKVEFTARRVDFTVAAADSYSHIKKSGWRLEYQGRVVITGLGPRPAHGPHDPHFPTFKDLNEYLKEEEAEVLLRKLS